MARGKLVRRKERLAGTFLLALTLINAVGVWRLAPLLRRGYQDFTAFYCGGLMVRSGEAARLYDLRLQYEVQEAFAPNVEIRQAALPYNHPPFEALLFVPFTHLSYFSAYLAWTLLNVVLLALSLTVAKKTFPEIGYLGGWFVTLAAFGFVPVVIALVQGQDSVLLLFLLTLALASLEKGSDVAAGAALGAGLFKFHIVLPLAVILAVRRPRLLLGFAPVAAALVAASAAVVGWRGVVDYVTYLLHLEKTGGGGAISTIGMPNLRGLIAELPGGGTGNTATLWLTIVCSIAIVALAISRVRRQGASIRFAFAVASVTAMMVSYHAIIHDLAWLLPIVLLLFAVTPARQEESRQDRRWDSILVMSTYTVVFLGSSVWPWLSPCWCVPVVIWIYWKFGKNRAAQRTA